MRTLLIYTLFGIALWYFGRAALRHYLGPRNTGSKMTDKNRSHPADRGGDNYRNARDVRYRDVE